MSTHNDTSRAQEAPNRQDTALNPGHRSLKILIFPHTWVLAHVGRTLMIAKELRDRGHEVVFAGEDEQHPSSRLSHARKEGFRTINNVKESAWHWAWARFQKYGVAVSAYDFFTTEKWAPLQPIIQSKIEVIEAEKPDLIVGDASVGLTAAAEITGTPAAGILNGYSALFLRPGSLENFMIRLMDKFVWSRARKKVYDHHGVQPTDAIELLKQTLMLAPDLTDFFTPYASQEEYPNWHPIGPLVSEPPIALPDWYDELQDGTPNIYITMGSTGLLDAMLRKSFKAFAKAPYRFVVTTANQVSEKTLAAAPDNFRFTDYAPGSKLLEHCQAMIFHGGNGSMYQALEAGVPVIALPCHMEQQVCSDIIEKENFGIIRNPRWTSGKRLLKDLETILNEPEYRANAWRHRNAVRHSESTRNAADLLESYAWSKTQPQQAAQQA